MKVLDHLLEAVCDATIFDPEVQVGPVCMRPDRDRQWEAVIPTPQAELPELMILDNYTSQKRIGLAIRLRCVKPLIGWNPESTTTT